MVKKICKEEYNNYIFKLRKGQSIYSISKKSNLDYSNLVKQLKKHYPKDYDKYIKGEVIGIYKEYSLRNRSWLNNFTEGYLHKGAKKQLTELGYIPEVAAYKDNKLYAVIDLYNPKTKVGIELVWNNKKLISSIIEKYEKYKKCYGKVIMYLLLDSRFRKRTRFYYITMDELKKLEIPFVVYDISKDTHKDRCIISYGTREIEG